MSRHPSVGDTVGRYRIVAELGAGGMATVYRARAEPPVEGRPAEVALKILDPGRVVEEDVKRFTREYKALARIDHENVVAVYEAGVHDHYPWLAMELVEGTDLESLIERWKASPPADRHAHIERILRGLCRGLQYVHDLGMVHRDLKPSNVLLTADGEPKLSDFGVVKGGSNTANTQLTMAGRLVGTVAFMAPELITAEGIDRRTDLYALGAVLYLMLTFRRPIEAGSVAGYLARHLTEVPQPPHEHDPSTPPHLERICQRLLQKDPAFRYPSAQAVVQALDRGDQGDALPVRGRDAQMSGFGRRLIALSDGAGGSVAIVGPKGSGKTHLLEAFVDQAKANDVKVAYTSSGPKGTLSRLLEAAGGQADGTVNDLKRLARLVRGTPWVLVLDDFDTASAGAISAVSRLMRQRVGIEGEPTLLVFSAADADGELASLISGTSTGLPSALEVLGPVDAKSVVAMLRDRGVTGAAAPALGRRLHADYGGQPGAIVEQLEALVDDGWFERVGDQLKLARPLDELRRHELPVPQAVAADVRSRVDALDAPCRDLAELLALLDRPASEALLQRCVAGDPDASLGAPERIEAMVQRGVLARQTVDTQEVLAFAHPCGARVVRGTLDGHRKRHHHGRIARALRARRRRANALEVAHHRRLSGDVEGAYPLYVQAARRAAREGRFGEVLEICRQGQRLRAAAERSLDPEERARMARWLHLLNGEALLARRAWAEAVAPLQAAVAESRREDDDQAVARCLSALGRAHYRCSDYAAAEPLLRDALQYSTEPTNERSAALRALADIELRNGRMADAKQLWQQALDEAIDAGNRSAEARARRGLAHYQAISGRLDSSASLLAEADDLLASLDEPRVRAGVLARLIELEAAAGRMGAAVWRAEALVELARQRDMAERLPEAYGLLAHILVFLGDDDDAHDAAQQAIIFANAHGGTAWASRLHAVRVLARLGQVDAAARALPATEDLPTDAIDDPAAQLAAVRARLCAPTDPLRARDLAAWALARTPPRLALRGARIALDAAIALTRAQQTDAARSAVKRGLKQLKGPGADALRLELLVAMHEAQPDHRVLDALAQIAPRIEAQLPPNAVAGFRARPVVRDALRRTAP
jgi:tetratricopeptide (TPR) repeat protein